MRCRTEFDLLEVQPHLWPKIARHLPPRKKTPFLKARRKGGRPRADDRRSFSAILWRLRCGGAWSRLPKQFGPARTARRRLVEWLYGGALERAWRTYLYQQSIAELERWAECFDLSSNRNTLAWRFGLEHVWHHEFASLYFRGKKIDQKPLHRESPLEVLKATSAIHRALGQKLGKDAPWRVPNTG